jgi:hypothetical protein
MSPEGNEMQNAEPSTRVTTPPSRGALALDVQGSGIGVILACAGGRSSDGGQG